MTKFHEGQEVEVLRPGTFLGIGQRQMWRKAKIVHIMDWGGALKDLAVYTVQFHDNTRGVFDEAHIRAVKANCDDKVLNAMRQDPAGPGMHRTRHSSDDWEVWPNSSTYKERDA